MFNNSVIKEKLPPGGSDHRDKLDWLPFPRYEWSLSIFFLKRVNSSCMLDTRNAKVPGSILFQRQWEQDRSQKLIVWSFKKVFAWAHLVSRTSLIWRLSYTDLHSKGFSQHYTIKVPALLSSSPVSFNHCCPNFCLMTLQFSCACGAFSLLAGT